MRARARGKHLDFASWSATAALLLASCASSRSGPFAPGATRLGQVRVTVPLSFLKGVPTVLVPFERQRPALFMLDTGASAVVVSKRLVERLGLPTEPFETDVQGAASRATMKLALTHLNLTIGEVTFDDVPAVVLDLDRLEAAAGVEIGGVLGWALWKRLLVTLDYPGHALVIETGSLPRPDGEEILPLLARRQIPGVRIAVRGEPLDVDIDSGCVGTLEAGAEAAGSWPTKRPWVAGPSMLTALGDDRPQLARISGAARIGRSTFVDPIVSQSADGSARLCRTVLEHFAITFDASNDAVRFATAEREPIDMQPWRSTGLGLRKQAGVWTVSDVIPQTPAASLDVKVGDRVVEVDGKPTSGFTVDDWLRLSEGSELSLTLEREGQALHVTVPVVDLVK